MQSITESHELQYPTLHKPPVSTLPVAPNLADYDAETRTYHWEDTEKALRLPRKNGYNKATICIDDHPPEVMRRAALIWEGTKGQRETYTFTDLMHATNRIANLFTHLGIQKGDRVFRFYGARPRAVHDGLRRAEGPGACGAAFCGVRPGGGQGSHPGLRGPFRRNHAHAQIPHRRHPARMPIGGKDHYCGSGTGIHGPGSGGSGLPRVD